MPLGARASVSLAGRLAARRMRRLGQLATALILATSPLVLLPGPASAAPGGAALEVTAETQGMADAYLRRYPQMSTEQALLNLYGQDARIRLLEALGDRGDDSFGGSWFDALTGLLHLATTDDALTGKYAELAEEFGVDAVAHLVAFSAEELRAVSANVNSGLDPLLGLLGRDQASVDFEENAVLVTVTSAAYETLGGLSFRGSHPSVVLVPGSPVVAYEEVCTSRRACGAPLRGGVVIHKVASSANCSLAYTASTSDGSRWAYTAGHCGTQLNYKWRHGDQIIGPVRETFDDAEVDVARIRIDNGYWLGSGGGYLYDQNNPNTPARLTLSITNRTTIEVDEVVCLNAQYSNPGYHCGVITAAYGPRNMPSVDFDACPGDSGGAWIFRPPGGTSQWAYGVHHGGTLTCHELFGYSIFTTVPDINIVFPTIRIEVRPS